MRIYVDIGHPAYFHFLRNFILLMTSKGHSFFITAREKDINMDLLRSYGINCISRGRGSHSSVGRLIYLIIFFLKNFRAIRHFNPVICISIGSPYMVLIARFLRKPGIVFEDTESAKKVIWIYKKFATVILTPSCFKLAMGRKQIYFDSYKELAYLHKKYYKPDPSIFQLLQIPQTQKYILFRFVSHHVNHDQINDGLTFEMRKILINNLSSLTTIFVSTEKGMKTQFPELELKIPPEKMHDVIAYSQLVIGESATMAAEAAVLGVPSVFFDNNGRGYTDELEHKYKMVSNYTVSFSSIEKATNKAVEILSSTDYTRTLTLFDRILKEKIDITSFLVWFIEKYPDSARIMRENPDYQYRFN